MKRTILLTFLLSFLTSAAWGAGHWVDVTTARTGGVDGTANYMRWSPVVSDATGTVTSLRISIRQYGSPTEIRLALYSQAGIKLAEGTATVTAGGYREIPVPPTHVTLGGTYYIAAQAVSGSLSKFDCGANSGGFEGPNKYANGFPQNLPGSWGDRLLTAGMFVEAGPTAAFQGAPTSGTAPLSVSFTDSSSGSITAWSWSFGDGGTDGSKNPTHDYLTPGSYSVGLTVTAPDGTDTLVKSNYVQVLEPIPPGNNEYLIQVDPAAHRKFGLYYPVTYKFRIPTGLSGLSAQYRYIAADWNTLPVRTSTEIFNGIDAARFDYDRGFAYISIRLSRASDNIYLRVIDGTGEPVSIVFDSIPPYYDERKAAVTITLDDWDIWADASFRLAVDQLNSLGLYYTVGLRLMDPPWASYQEKINQSGDFLEITSHTIYHSCDPETYQLHGYDTEIVGSRDLIRLYLTFPAHPYIPLFMEPCGYSDDTLQSWVTTGDYLISRSVVDPLSGFAPWDQVAGRYSRYGVTYDWWGNDTQSAMNAANALFDSTLAAGGIYHFMDHPWQTGHFVAGSYEMQHLNHIKGRTNVWYVPFGQMYLYHYLQEMRGGLTVMPVSTTPTANFSATPLSGAPPLSTTFTDTSTGPVTAWSWDFGDGGTSTLQNPVHVYTTAGAYTVSLTVTGTGGSDTKTQTGYITVSTPPVAGFTATPLSGAAPLSAAFTDTSTGSVTTWSWDFGDGGTSTLRNPVHTYTTAGAYTVGLTVTGPGGSDTKTLTGYVTVSPAPPVAGFTATPLSGPTPLSVTFTDTSTGSVTAWSWDFGDGGTSTLRNPVHTYTTVGAYTVGLTVTGPAGTDTMTKPAYIQAQETPPAPVAAFSAAPTTGTVPLAVHFTDASTGVISAWSWDFGDGGASTLQNPDHSYTAAGTYTVTLTVTGPGGSNGMTRTGYIQAQQGSIIPHWVDVTTAKTTGMDGTANYMSWSPLAADATGSVTRLRISIRQYGSPTQIRLGLYSQAGARLTEGTATVSAAGYVEIAVPAAAVLQGNTYYLAAQAASPGLYKFDCGAATGGLEGPNSFGSGLPQALPGGWGYKLLTGGMFIQ